MNGDRPAEAKVATLLATAGDSCHYVAAITLAYGSGGPLLTGAYLLINALPSTVSWRLPRWFGLIASASYAWLGYMSDSISAETLLMFGMLAGSGAAFGRRSPFWTAGLISRPGWGALAGVVAAGVVGMTLGTAEVLYSSAALTLCSLVFGGGQGPQRRTRLPAILVPSVIAASLVVGLRVFEAAFGSGVPPGPAVFAGSWALGANLGWKYSPTADARAVLSAPFVAAMALSVEGIIEGPGLIFLHALIAGCIALVAGVGRDAAPSDAPYFGRSALIWMAAIGAVLGGVARSFEVASWSVAGALLAGGFASSVAARRKVLPPPAPVMGARIEPREARRISITPRVARIAPPVAARAQAQLQSQKPASAPTLRFQAPPVENLQDAVKILRSALDVSRRIRADAISECRWLVSGRTVADAQERVSHVMGDLGESVRQLKTRGGSTPIGSR